MKKKTGQQSTFSKLENLQNFKLDVWHIIYGQIKGADNDSWILDILIKSTDVNPKATTPNCPAECVRSTYES